MLQLQAHSQSLTEKQNQLRAVPVRPQLEPDSTQPQLQFPQTTILNQT